MRKKFLHHAFKMKSIQVSYLQTILHQRPVDAHKGLFGRALLIAGSREMCGAAILAARASLRSGLGLLHVHAPESIYACLQAAVPEAMVQRDRCSELAFADTQLPIDTFDAIGIGPGLNIGETQTAALESLLQRNFHLQKPMVIDADALNIIARKPSLLSYLSEHCILTPHPKEFQRLLLADAAATQQNSAFTKSDITKEHNHTSNRLAAGEYFAKKYRVHLVLKGAQSLVIQPNGDYRTNTTGNSGMATGGSGDVLTGILLSLLAQQYTCQEAALLGVYLHGLSGDLALKNESEESLTASDLYKYLGAAFKTLKTTL